MTIFYTPQQVLEDFLCFEGFTLTELFGPDALQINVDICYTRRYSNVFKHRSEGNFEERRTKALKRLHRFTELYSRPAVATEPDQRYKFTLYKRFKEKEFRAVYAGNNTWSMRMVMLKIIQTEKNTTFLILNRRGDVIYPDPAAMRFLGQLMYIAT